MVPCPYCGFKNNRANVRCEQCGKPFEIIVRPRQEDRTTLLVLSQRSHPQGTFTRPRRRSQLANRLIGAIFYWVGAVCIDLSLISLLLLVSERIAILVGLALIPASLTLFILSLVKRQRLYLNWLWRLLWELTTILVALIILLAIGFTVGSVPGALPDVLYRCTFLLCGLVMVFVALW